MVKSQPQSWTGAWKTGMLQTAMYATGANPTLVQNDEHILVKGHRPGRSIVAVYKWGRGCDTVPGYASWRQCGVFVLAGCRTLQVAGVSGFMCRMLPWIACQISPHIWWCTVQLKIKLNQQWYRQLRHWILWHSCNKANIIFLSSPPPSFPPLCLNSSRWWGTNFSRWDIFVLGNVISLQFVRVCVCLHDCVWDRERERAL